MVAHADSRDRLPAEAFRPGSLTNAPQGVEHDRAEERHRSCHSDASSIVESGPLFDDVKL
jgi:hypothetical protein